MLRYRLCKESSDFSRDDMCDDNSDGVDEDDDEDGE